MPKIHMVTLSVCLGVFHVVHVKVVKNVPEVWAYRIRVSRFWYDGQSWIITIVCVVCSIAFNVRLYHNCS
jgi:hypothetical protein